MFLDLFDADRFVDEVNHFAHWSKSIERDETCTCVAVSAVNDRGYGGTRTSNYKSRSSADTHEWGDWVINVLFTCINLNTYLPIF